MQRKDVLDVEKALHIRKKQLGILHHEESLAGPEHERLAVLTFQERFDVSAASMEKCFAVIQMASEDERLVGGRVTHFYVAYAAFSFSG